MEFTLEVVTNTTCNLGCYFCFAKDNSEMSSHMLSLDDFKKSIDFILDKIVTKDDSLFVKIYGGEATFNKNLFNMIDYLDTKNINNNISCVLITNLTNEIDKIIEMLNKYNYFNIAVSMEGSKEMHNNIRFFKANKLGSYDVIISNINKIIENSNHKRITIQSVLSPDLVLNMDDYINFIDTHKNIGSFQLMPMNDMTFKDIDLSLLDNALDKLTNYYIDKYNVNDFAHIGLFQFQRIKLSSLMDLNYRSFCQIGTLQLTIMPNGDIYPCSKAYYSKRYELCYGNINILSFDELFDKFDSLKNYYRELTSLKVTCNKCINNHVGCVGLCIMENNSSNHHVCNYNIILDKYMRKLDKIMPDKLDYLLKLYRKKTEECDHK